MNTDKNQRPSTNDEPPVGSGPDRITKETPRCERKNVPCPYYSDAGCAVQGEDSQGPSGERINGEAETD